MLFRSDGDMARAAARPEDLVDRGGFVDLPEYTRYQKVLNLPGKTTGSYSRNLNHLWAVGSALLLWDAGQEKGDSTSLQREFSARARFGNSTHASRALREMIARPKISRNEWKTTEI